MNQPTALRTVVDVGKQIVAEWSEDKAPRLGAALAYYSVFALGPFLIVVIGVAGWIFGQDAAEHQIMEAVQGLIGPQGTEVVQTMIVQSRKPTSGMLATLFSIGMLLLGAAGLFGQLKDALNTIWEVQPRPGKGIWGTLRERLLSVSALLGTVFLLLVSLVVSAALSGLGSYLSAALPGGVVFWQIVNFLLSFGVVTLLFALLFKYLPDAEIAWGDVWIGAALTALLFTLGKLAIGLYLGNSNPGSAYGAASSLVVVMIWVYYSAQILFLGAEFTQVYANRFGSRIVPAEDAVPLTQERREQQGMPRQHS